MKGKRRSVAVENCGMCPFVHSMDGPLICIAETLTAGQGYRHVTTPSDRRPPRWCPLRKADHLVTLRSK